MSLVVDICSTIDDTCHVSILVPQTFIDPSDSDQGERHESQVLRLYRVPLEHFPSLENYYPARAMPSTDDIEAITETKPSKIASAQAKKSVAIIDIDRTAIIFDEKIKDLFRQR
jgi:hypothetical protein